MTDTTAKPTTGTVVCDDCGERHVAEYDHNGRKDWDDADTRYFAVVCTVDGLTGYYRESAVSFDAAPATVTAESLGLDLAR